MSPQSVDLTGQKIGRWSVIAEAERVGYTRRWQCRCECGTERAVTQCSLRKGDSVSCGCYAAEQTSKRRKKHGHSVERTTEYTIWKSMKYRCHSTGDSSYHRYGARGIEVCERWRNSFENFLEDMGPRPSLDHSLERIDNEGNYCPENCRWATKTEQARNRRTNHFVTLNGETKTLMEWSEITGLGYTVITGRLNRGWTAEEALTLKPGATHRWITYNGETKRLNDWSRQYNVPRERLGRRLKNGWSFEEAVGIPKLT